MGERNIRGVNGAKAALMFREPARRRRRSPSPGFYGFLFFVAGTLALIGLIAVALLVRGLLNVHGVTEHFSIH